MERVSIDSWPNRAFSIEIYPAVASKCLKELNSQNMIETIFPKSKYLVHYGELFSVLSWQVFKGHFETFWRWFRNILKVISKLSTVYLCRAGTSMRSRLFLLCELLSRNRNECHWLDFCTYHIWYYLCT